MEKVTQVDEVSASELPLPLQNFTPPKVDHGYIVPARGTVRRITDELAAQLNRQMSGEDAPSPYLVYPAAAAITTSLFNPIAAAQAIIKGTIGAEAINITSKLAGHGTWGEHLGKTLNINPDIAEFTNPGYLLGGINNKLSNNSIKKIVSSIKNNNKINKVIGLLGNNIKHSFISNTPPLLESNTKQILRLPIFDTKNRINLGSSIVMPSSNKVYKLLDGDSQYRRTLLSRMNKIFNSRYGYKPISLDIATDQSAVENAIKSRMIQHNTFVRGTGDDPAHQQATNKVLQNLGLSPIKENRLRRYVTHYAPPTGHGRSGFYHRPFYPTNPGTIYSSNSFNVARGYSEARGGRDYGGVYVVRRPLDFSSNDMVDWITNNEFKFHGAGSSKTGSDFFDYNLGHYLRTGKTLTGQYLEEHPIQLDYNKIKEQVLADKYSQLDPEIVKARHANIKARLKSLGINPDDVPLDARIDKSTGALALSWLESDFHNYLENLAYDKDKILAEHWLSANPNYEFIPEEFIPHSWSMRPARFKDKLSGNEINAKDIFSTMDVGSIFTPKAKGYYYGRKKNQLSTIQRRIEEQVEKDVKKAIQAAKINYAANIDLSKYAAEKGITKQAERHLVFGDKRRPYARKNSKYDSRQHFVWVGKIGEPGLEIVRKVPYREIKEYYSTHGVHSGPYTKGLSRKSKKYGGILHKCKLEPSKEHRVVRKELSKRGLLPKVVLEDR